MGKEKIDHELISALVDFACRTPCERGTREIFERVILDAVDRQGHLACCYCGATMRDHVMRAIRSRIPMKHDFLELGHGA
jgi:hypothetical protein